MKFREMTIIFRARCMSLLCTFIAVYERTSNQWDEQFRKYPIYTTGQHTVQVDDEIACVMETPEDVAPSAGVADA
jgi:hypothetical protein